jgi:hypothetical protein
VSSGDAVFRRIQSVARSAPANGGTGAPTQEYLIRHTLESFLDRLTPTGPANQGVRHQEGGAGLGDRATSAVEHRHMGAEVHAHVR